MGAAAVAAAAVSGGGSQSGAAKAGPDGKSAMREAGRNWAAGLNEGQSHSIYDYTCEIPNYYKNINGVLRGREKSFGEGNELRCEQIHSALRGASTPCEATVYRGCSSAALEGYAGLPDEALTGATIMDRGFTSTSLDSGGAFPGDVLLVIDLPKGSPAANIEQLSAAGKYESEVLIDRGQIFRIKRAYHDADGRRVVEVTMVN